MNAADIINLCTYTLVRVQKIANGEPLGLTDWSEMDDEDRVEEIRDEIEQALGELRSQGVEIEHNL